MIFDAHQTTCGRIGLVVDGKARPAPMTHATISFKDELAERLGVPHRATPPANFFADSRSVILEVMLSLHHSSLSSSAVTQ